ncbi:MAG: four helix bundle protein [Acidobacteriaceae bacterium]
MARTRYFRDLLVWQKSMKLARDVYQATNGFPQTERFGLTMQLRRAAVSVPSNIAEGHGRLSDKSLRVFLAQARGSLYEVETQLQLAVDLNYLASAAAGSLNGQCDEVAMMINGLLSAIERTVDTSGR